jgi:hypothetical protein
MNSGILMAKLTLRFHLFFIKFLVIPLNSSVNWVSADYVPNVPNVPKVPNVPMHKSTLLTVWRSGLHGELVHVDIDGAHFFIDRCVKRGSVQVRHERDELKFSKNKEKNNYIGVVALRP